MNAKITVLVAAIAAIALIIVFNPFKQPQALPEDENLADENSFGVESEWMPEEIEAHEQQLKESDPVRYQALKEKNPAVCDSEPKPEDIDWCKAAVAELLKDESICTALKGFAADQCYGDIAREKLDLGLCSKINDAYLMDECTAKIAASTGNLGACFEVQNPDMGDDCIAAIALDKNDAIICNKVRDELFKVDCEMNIEQQANAPETGE